MFQIISAAHKKSLSDLFGATNGHGEGFSFSSSIQKYILYVFIGIAALLLIKVVVKAIRSATRKEEVADSPYQLRKLSTRIEHFKGLVSSKTAFTYRFFDEKENNWHDGKFLSMDKNENMVLALFSTTGKPQEHLNKILEIKYPVDKNMGIIKSSLLKYVGSKKSGKNDHIRMYMTKLPPTVKLEPKRKEIRFKVSPDFPIRVYLLSDKLDIPVATNCLDFSASGILIEVEELKIGWLEYIIKKDKIISAKNLGEGQAEKLTFYKILSQPDLGFKEFREAKKRKEQNLKDWIGSIQMAKDFILSIKKNDTVQLFFILPELPLLEEAKEELLSLDNRTIMCDAIVNTKTMDRESGKYQLAMNFLDIDDLTRDTLYQYGLESWRE